jgi:hypothetical protein
MEPVRRARTNSTAARRQDAEDNGDYQAADN